MLLIEAFAYFFLNLYKQSLSGIKYFQNEITNIETKLTAAVLSLASGNAEQLQHIIQRLADSERNFILEKGQRTVDAITEERQGLLIDRAVALVQSVAANTKKET